MNFHGLLLAAFYAAAPLAARADAVVHMKSPIYGCEKAPAARVLNNQADSRQGDPRWVAYVMGDGQCVRITTQSPWAVTGADENGVTLVSYRGTVGRPGSFYVPTWALDFPAPVLPPADAAAPVTPPSDASMGGTSPPANDAPPANADQGPPAPSAASQPSGATDNPPGISATTPQSSKSVPPATNEQDLAQLKADIAKVDPSTSSIIGPPFIFLFVVAIGGAIWIAVVRTRARKRESHRKMLLAAVRAEIAFNTQALRVKRIHTVQRDEFGTVNWAKWLEARDYYFNTRILPIVSQSGLSDLPIGFADTVRDMIEAAATSEPAMGSLAEVESFVSSPESFDSRMHPVDYEMFCARQLQRAGWDTRMTATTGDQGADVIAEHRGRRLVVQCKLYNTPVGNDAVQQVHAAKAFQQAQLAAVVSNQPYTRSAKQLAATNGVYLLHHAELHTFRPAQAHRAAT